MSHKNPYFKTPLRSLLADNAVINELAGASLESAKNIESVQRLDVATKGNAAGYSQTEAIILLTGRPALLIKNGIWEEPKSEVIRGRIDSAKVSLTKSIPKVGRVEILDYRTDFVGTGWMIDEGILITNRHVAALFAEKRADGFSLRADTYGDRYRVQVDFLREYDRSATSISQIKDILFVEEDSDLRPDLAMVRLDNLTAFPDPIDLDSVAPKIELDIAAIGYPAYDPRNDTFEMDDIFKRIYNVKRLSPGRIMGVGKGKLLEHDCTTLGGSSGSVLINLDTGNVCGLHFSGSYLTRNFAVTSSWLKERLAELKVSVRIPLHLNVKDSFQNQEARPNVESGRVGYLETFLGYTVPVPEITAKQKALIAPVKNQPNGLLSYSHFSICMRSDRRLPFYTAANIDGDQLYNFPRGSDQWYLEHRLEVEEHQLDNRFYQNSPFNRGHLVRRLDPAWGGTRAMGKLAEADTFFFTNCAPQHRSLNQKTWLSLEDYVLSNARASGLKVSVFTGPVMSEKDREYRGVKIPIEFWKVVAFINSFTGKLSATGYILSQADYMSAIEFVFGEFKTYQTPIQLIEAKTGLYFEVLRNYDPLSFTEAKPHHEILSASDIIY